MSDFTDERVEESRRFWHHALDRELERAQDEKAEARAYARFFTHLAVMK